MKRIILLALICITILCSIPVTAYAAGQYVGSKESDVFHDPDCPYVERIADRNLVWYGNILSARIKGKRPCSFCQPDKGDYVRDESNDSNNAGNTPPIDTEPYIKDTEESTITPTETHAPSIDNGNDAGNNVNNSTSEESVWQTLFGTPESALAILSFVLIIIPAFIYYTLTYQPNDCMGAVSKGMFWIITAFFCLCSPLSILFYFLYKHIFMTIKQRCKDAALTREIESSPEVVAQKERIAGMESALQKHNAAYTENQKILAAAFSDDDLRRMVAAGELSVSQAQEYARMRKSLEMFIASAPQIAESTHKMIVDAKVELQSLRNALRSKKNNA